MKSASSGAVRVQEVMAATVVVRPPSSFADARHLELTVGECQLAMIADARHLKLIVGGRHQELMANARHLELNADAHHPAPFVRHP